MVTTTSSSVTGIALGFARDPRIQCRLDLRLEALDFVERDPLAGAAQARAYKVEHFDLVLDKAVERLGDQEARARLLVRLLDPACHIDDITDGRQSFVADRADRAEQRFAVVQADPDVEVELYIDTTKDFMRSLAASV